ncbi:hypothetical protein V8F20_011840 [Naviculisporaceae sp. PSN 640]
MDDPWGSPWTTADTDKEQKAPSSPTKSDLEPPPRAFLSVSSSPRIPTIVGQSPWADDEDGFGDWAAADTGAATQSGWGGGWPSPSPSLTAPSRDDEFGKSSPIAWPGSIAIAKPRSSSIRQPSPDPWAAEFPAQTPTNDGPLTPRPIPDSLEPITADLKEHGDANIVITSDWDDQQALDSVEKEETQHDGAGDPFVLPPAEEPMVLLDKPELTPTPAESARSSFDSAARGRTRPASVPSDDDSDREDERQDSPITSIDEDSKARQKVARKASGKVQELVVKFDGLARAASQEPPPVISRARSKSNPDEKTRSPEAAEFGDFEDAHDPEPRRPSTAGENMSSPTFVGEAQATKPESVVDPTSPPPNGHSEEQSMTKLDPVKFDVDLGKLDDLLGKEITMTAADLCDASLGVSDHIITDSFGEISERKTWYRVSRLGSSRKHNAGDDENYRRVGWDTSTVRLDTIKIVRRWMEEDSIAGRANLGGGTSRTQKNMFGWDSSAEPVTLDAVFGKKKSAHARASSLKLVAPLQPPSPSLSFAGSTSGTPTASNMPNGGSQRPQSLALPPTASFGWSSSPAPPVIKPPLSSISPATQPAPPKPAQTEIPPLAKPIPQPVSVSLANSSAVPVDDDDDDDWGEMVSSPSEPKAHMNGFPDIANAFSATAIIPPATGNFETPTPSGPEHLPNPARAPAPATASDLDAWASVDFSVFEKPVETKQAPITAPSTTAADTLASLLSPTSAVTPVSAAPSAASVQPALASPYFTPTTPLKIASPMPLPTPTDLSGGLDDLTSPSSQDEAVMKIIANLPDLSYMLR